MLFIILRAYSLGGGAYTGIEAVSNGVQILREPKVPNAKQTMLYMAVSLAFTAGGIILGYLLTGSRPHPTEGHERRARGESLRRLDDRRFAHRARSSSSLTLISAGRLLFVAAQTGFLDGPRILANMAVDSWVPRRFAQLSDRLVTNNGIWLMGLAAAARRSCTRAAPSRACSSCTPSTSS